MAGILVLICLASSWMLCAEAAKVVRANWGLKVYVQASITSLRKLSAVDSSYLLEGQVSYAWRDDSLFQAANDGDVYPGPDRLDSLSTFAYTSGSTQVGPHLVPLLAGRQSSSYDSLTFTVHYTTPEWTGLPADDSATYVVGIQRFSGVFLQSQSLADFPFDTQTAHFRVEIQNYEDPDMSFVLVPLAAEIFSPPSAPEGWTLGTVSAGVDTREYKAAKVVSSRVSFSVTVKRIPTFYVNRFVMPVCLMVTMSILSISFAPSFTVRLSSHVSAFGTIVSFLFVSSQSVPQLPYPTRLDRFFSLEFFIVFGLYLYSSWAYTTNERMTKVFKMATERNAGKLDYLWLSGRSNVVSSTPPATNIGKDVATPVDVGDPASAAPKPKTPLTVLGALLDMPVERSDLIATLLFAAAQIVGVTLICSGPSPLVSLLS